jgi:hypothetical protein
MGPTSAAMPGPLSITSASTPPRGGCGRTSAAAGALPWDGVSAPSVVQQVEQRLLE